MFVGNHVLYPSCFLHWHSLWFLKKWNCESDLHDVTLVSLIGHSNNPISPKHCADLLFKLAKCHTCYFLRNKWLCSAIVNAARVNFVKCFSKIPVARCILFPKGNGKSPSILIIILGDKITHRTLFIVTFIELIKSIVTKLDQLSRDPMYVPCNIINLS